MKKLIEGLPFYQDKLHEETVFNKFNDILVKVTYPIPQPNSCHSCMLSHRPDPISLPTNLILN